MAASPYGRSAEGLFQSVVEFAPIGVVMVDRAGRIHLVNREMERLFGYSREELLGEAVERLIPGRFAAAHPEYRDDFVREPRRRAMGAGRDLYGLRKDGREIPVEVGLNPIETSQGLFVLASVVDISARQRAEARFRVAVEASPSGVVMVDDAGTIVLVNRETERLFGYGREELLGHSIEKLVPGQFRAEHPSFREGFFARPQRRAMGAGRDLFGRRKDGTEVPVEIGLNPIETDEGMFVLASVVDISARKHAELELRRSNEELERFAYVASHDLQEPLRTVTSYVQLIERRYDDLLDADGRDFIGFAVEGAKRMQALIQDLLAFSRVGTRGAAIERTDADAVVDAAVESLRAAITETGARIEREPLPEVLADPGQLRQLFTNLLGNALKFHADAPPVIQVGARRAGRMWTFSVRDNGIGIEPEYFDRIFVIFQRLQEPEAYPGTGIGLAICKKIVERHGGRIWVESTPGEGSAFLFTLPSVPEV